MFETVSALISIQGFGKDWIHTVKMGLFGKKVKEEKFPVTQDDEAEEDALPLEGVVSHAEDSPVPVQPQAPRSPYTGSPVVAPAGIVDEKTQKILRKVDEATRTMEMNIAAAAERGENLDDLQEKTSEFLGDM